MIDPITQTILENDMLDHMLEGYNMKCGECGKVITVVKDGSGPYECCHRRMFVMKSDLDPEKPMEEKTALFTPDNQAVTQKEREKDWEKEEEKYETRQVANTKVESTGLLGDIEYYYGDQQEQENLEELTKTRSAIGRLAKRAFDPAYAQRRKDLLTLRKKGPTFRRTMSKQIAKTAEKQPGILARAIKAKKISGDKAKAAQIRRQASAQFGGYEKAALIRKRSAERKAEEQKRKMELRRKFQAAKSAKIDKMVGQYRKKLQAAPVKIRRKTPPPAVTSPRDKFKGGAWMGVD